MPKEKPQWSAVTTHRRRTSDGEVEVQTSTIRLAWLRLTVVKGHSHLPEGFVGLVDPLDERYVLQTARTLDEAKIQLFGIVEGKIQQVLDAIEESEREEE